jgi:predicted nucleotidyltransferase component of viral defense system
MASLNIRDSSQMEKAKLEDILVELLYARYPDLTFHGGTSIWRCYSGNRFSRDIDFYCNTASKSASTLYKEFGDFFKKSGFAMKSRNYDDITQTMHFLVEAETKMKIDINLKYRKGTPTEYTKVDGSKLIVLALTPAELLGEKIDTYLNKLENADGIRQPEAQDLYDIYHLTTILIDGGNSKLKAELRDLLKRINGSPPSGMKTLGNIILSGIAPSFDLLIKSIGEWAK